ncbi:tyrosine-type recombinase/integrase [Vibrio parahaemolyticus]
MRKVRVKKCQYAISPRSKEALFCDVYVLVDEHGRMLFQENLWLLDIARNSPIETTRAYACDLLSFLKAMKPLGGWSAIKPRDLTGYLHGELFQHRNYKKATIQRHITTIKSFYEWQEERGYLEVMPAFDWAYEHLYSSELPDKQAHNSRQHSLHSSFIEKDVFYYQLLPSVRSNYEFIRLRDQLCLRLGYECGTRAHEVLKLDTEQVRKLITEMRENNDGLWGTVKIKISGKGALNRDLLIPPQQCEFIWDYLVKYRNKMNHGLGPLICDSNGLPLQNSKHASTVFKHAWRNAGLPRTQHQGYHRLRKSYGTNLVNDCYNTGEDPWVLVPRRLGHRNVSTTFLYIQFDALKNQRSKVIRELDMMESKYRAIQNR